ncbi:TrmH family RNA methyltransferase [Caloramator proteoclasticus]|uniref:RNA methyltransferase, TrmH family n=1 Tax=Caloramator proteoclasticus DSM 10124 TaxID=1121262 RepID=A0A1M4XD56_9CLOT|nr:RNA methyltransferase [Caloramator proteoclasticus]SHE91467.1 RNA methyltransferase, TrmH family [Caloramator proteoclasticus DSM 10124]
MILKRDSSLVKNALKLKQKKYRELENKFLAEGIRFVEEAILEGLVDHIFYSSQIYELKGNERVLDNNIPKYEVDEKTINELTNTTTPQSVVAVVNKPNVKLKNDLNFVVLVDRVQDPGNLGTIIRTCDAANVDAVYIVKGTVDVYNDKTLRSTMGSIFHLPIVYFDSFKEAAEDLYIRGFNIYASTLDGENVYKTDFKGKTAIVIGNEANGMSKEDIMLCNKKIKIPMLGRAESLNASIAAAIIIYEVVRQRL